MSEEDGRSDYEDMVMSQLLMENHPLFPTTKTTESDPPVAVYTGAAAEPEVDDKHGFFRRVWDFANNIAKFGLFCASVTIPVALVVVLGEHFENRRYTNNLGAQELIDYQEDATREAALCKEAGKAVENFLYATPESKLAATRYGATLPVMTDDLGDGMMATTRPFDLASLPARQAMSLSDTMTSDVSPDEIQKGVLDVTAAAKAIGYDSRAKNKRAYVVFFDAQYTKSALSVPPMVTEAPTRPGSMAAIVVFDGTGKNATRKVYVFTPKDLPSQTDASGPVANMATELKETPQNAFADLYRQANEMMLRFAAARREVAFTSAVGKNASFSPSTNQVSPYGLWRIERDIDAMAAHSAEGPKALTNALADLKTDDDLGIPFGQGSSINFSLTPALEGHSKDDLKKALATLNVPATTSDLETRLVLVHATIAPPAMLQPPYSFDNRAEHVGYAECVPNAFTTPQREVDFLVYQTPNGQRNKIALVTPKGKGFDSTRVTDDGKTVAGLFDKRFQSSSASERAKAVKRAAQCMGEKGHGGGSAYLRNDRMTLQ
jgi:hypothetical protein